MSLEPCKVCGTLNAEETEICLSCGYPTQGHKRPVIFRWIAIALVVCFALPFASGLINWVLLQLKPESPTPTQTSRRHGMAECFLAYSCMTMTKKKFDDRGYGS